MFTQQPFQSPVRPLLHMVLAGALLAPLATADEGVRYASETFGTATGDTPLPDVGLVLELVDGDTSEPKLRLFGGFPGNAATILISGNETATVVRPPRRALDRAAMRLVGWDASSFHGVFDAQGYYEVALGSHAARALETGTLYAQGMHTGTWGIDEHHGEMLELSNGVEITRVEPEETRLTLDELRLHLPRDRESDVEWAKGLQEKLRTALDSENDSVVLKLGVGANAGIGANLGAGLKMNFEVTRIAGGQYILVLDAEAAGKVGLELADGIEVNGILAYGGKQEYRFHSIPGVVRGIRGLWIAYQLPELRPGAWVNGKLEQWEARDRAREALASARDAEQSAVSELRAAQEFLFDVAEVRVEKQRKLCEEARADRERARRKLADARVKTPALVAEVATTRARYAALEAALEIAERAYDGARTAVDAARAIADEMRERRCQALNELIQLHRMAWVVRQTRLYVTRHHHAFVQYVSKSSEAEAMLGVPGVRVKNFGAGGKVSEKMQHMVRFEFATEHRPRRVSWIRTVELAAEVVGGYVLGGRVELKRSIVSTDTWEFGPEVRHTENSVTLTADTAVLHGLGFVYAELWGVGRSRSISANAAEFFPNVANAFDLLRDDGLLASVAGANLIELGYSLQDRRMNHHEFELAASYLGNGGSIQVSLEWTDQGRRLAEEMTVVEAVQRLIDRIVPAGFARRE